MLGEVNHRIRSLSTQQVDETIIVSRNIDIGVLDFVAAAFGGLLRQSGVSASPVEVIEPPVWLVTPVPPPWPVTATLPPPEVIAEPTPATTTP